MLADLLKKKWQKKPLTQRSDTKRNVEFCKEGKPTEMINSCITYCTISLLFRFKIFMTIKTKSMLSCFTQAEFEMAAEPSSNRILNTAHNRRLELEGEVKTESLDLNVIRIS